MKSAFFAYHTQYGMVYIVFNIVPLLMFLDLDIEFRKVFSHADAAHNAARIIHCMHDAINKHYCEHWVALRSLFMFRHYFFLFSLLLVVLSTNLVSSLMLTHRRFLLFGYLFYSS